MNFRREPILLLSVAVALLGIVATLDIDFFNQTNAGATIAVINAVAGLISAFAVKPVGPAPFIYLMNAVVALLASYGMHLGEPTVAAINAAIVVIVTNSVRNAVTPTGDQAPISPSAGQVR